MEIYNYGYNYFMWRDSGLGCHGKNSKIESIIMDLVLTIIYLGREKEREGGRSCVSQLSWAFGLPPLTKKAVSTR